MEFMTTTFTRIHPPPAREVAGIHADVLFPGSHPGDPSLPFVAMNMVSSLDGKVSAGGKSGSIGSPVDREAMRTLRSKADAVMVGAGTLRAERVSLTSEGLRTPEPFAILASRTLDLPIRNLLHAEKERTIILTSEDSPRRRRDILEGYGIIVACGEGSCGATGLRDGLGRLKEEYGIGSILLEGGSVLNHSLVSGSLVSEIFLTVSPKLIGGESVGILSGEELSSFPEAELLSIHMERASSGSQTAPEVFLRYLLPAGFR